MNNNGFNFYPLLLAGIIGIIVAVLTFAGTITVGTLTTALIVLSVIAVLILILTIALLINYNSINAVNNIQQMAKDICNRICVCDCNVCPLFLIIFYALVVFGIFTAIAFFVGLAVASTIIAILVFVIFTAFAIAFFAFIQLLICILREICNE